VTAHYPIGRVGEILAIDQRAVKALIRSGELRASDVAPAGSRYHKWRVSQDDLDLFLERRVHAPPAPATRRRRRRDDHVIRFNYD